MMSLTTVSQLQNLIHNQIGTHFRQPETENIPVAQSVGRVLAQDIVSPINVPNANVSAMDGYALAHHAATGDVLRLVG